MPSAPTAGALFTPKTIQHILSLFKNYCFNYLKQPENHKDLSLKIYTLILAILIRYLNLQHLKTTNIRLSNVKHRMNSCCARSRQRSDTSTCMLKWMLWKVKECMKHDFSAVVPYSYIRLLLNLITVTLYCNAKCSLIPLKCLMCTSSRLHIYSSIIHDR